MRRSLGALLAVLSLAASSGCTSARWQVPECSSEDRLLVLMAQAVPSATMVPCVADLQPGWSYAGFEVTNRLARFWLDSDRAGIGAVEVDLTGSCDTSGASEVPPAADEVGARVFVEPGLQPTFTGARLIVFEGGCVTHRYRFATGISPGIALEADEGLSLLPRSQLVEAVRDRFELTLCGAGAEPCAG